MKIIQYSGWSDEPETTDFNNLDELLNIDFVKSFAEQDGFYQYSYSNNLLIAECDNGKKWWVVGLLPEGNVGLPKWEPMYEII